MGTTADKLNYMLETKEAIKTSLINKGASVDDTTPFRGYASAIDNLSSGGGDTFYDIFWDNYQQNGEKNDYNCSFAYDGWTDKTFKPKYNIAPNNAARQMFVYSKITDFVSILEECGVSLDLSKTKNIAGVFSYCEQATRIPPIDCTSVINTGGTSLFRGCAKLETIIMLNCQDYEFHTTYNIFHQSFLGCSALKHLTISGVICSNIALQWSPNLTLESAKNVLSCLKNYKGTADENKASVAFHANVLSLLEAEGATSPNGNTWVEYARDKGWNI